MKTVFRSGLFVLASFCDAREREREREREVAPFFEPHVSAFSFRATVVFTCTAKEKFCKESVLCAC
jgi:hypothetical protein